MVTQTIALNQLSVGVAPRVHAVQGDTGRQLNMRIADRTVDSGATGSLTFERVDRTVYAVTATFDSTTGVFTADITQALTQPGVTKCQLKITESSKTVSTYTFEIIVQKSTDGELTPQEGVKIDEALATAQQAYNISTALIGDLENDGDYILRRENGQSSYVPIPDLIIVDTTSVNIELISTGSPTSPIAQPINNTSVNVSRAVPSGYTHIASFLRSTGSSDVYCYTCYGSNGTVTCSFNSREQVYTFSCSPTFYLICKKN